MKKLILYSILLLFSINYLTLNAQDCTSCPAGSAVTLDGSSYPASATFQWTCTNGFSSSAQSPVFNPNASCECTLVVTEGACTVEETLSINVCNCDDNDPCIDMSFDSGTDCVTITNNGNVSSPVNTDSTWWKDDNTDYAEYTSPVCGCDIYEKVNITPDCYVSGSYFHIGGNNFDVCPGESIWKVAYTFPNDYPQDQYPAAGATSDYYIIDATTLENAGSSMTAYFQSNTSEGVVFSKIVYTYNNGGLDCANITSQVVHQGKIYKDIWGKRIVDYSDACESDTCEIELDIPQVPDECQNDVYVEKFFTASCGGSHEGFYCFVIDFGDPVNFQWYRDGTILAGETGQYICTDGEPDGEYCCEVTSTATGCIYTGCKIKQTPCSLGVTITESGGTLTATLSNCSGTPTYEWAWDNNGTWQVVGGNSSTYNTGGTEGDYKCTVECDGDGCQAIGYYTYIVNCTASVALTNQTTYLQADVSNCGGSSIEYVWKRYNGGIWTTVRTITKTSTTDTYTPTVSDTYKCTITCDGCTDQATISWNSGDPCSNFSVEINGTFTGLCVGDNYTYSYTPTNGTNPYTQVWKINGSQVATTSTYTYTPGSTGTVTISVTVTDDDGCQYTDSKSLSIINCCSMSVSISPSSITVCQNENATFNATPSNGTSPYSYSWTSQISGGSIVSEGSGNPKTLNKSVDGTYNVVVTVTDDDGCQATDNSTLTVDNCNDCDCTLSLTLDANCILHGTFTGAGCGTFDYELQYSETGTGWWNKLSGGPPPVDFDYTPTENGYYRLVSYSSSCGSKETPIVYVGCACTAPSDIWVHIDKTGPDINDVHPGTHNIYTSSIGVDCLDSLVTFETLHGIGDGKEVTVSVSGDLQLLSSNPHIAGNNTNINLKFSNISTGSSSMTIRYCLQDYVFNFTHDVACCYSITITNIVDGGCYTEADAGDLAFDYEFVQAHPGPNNSDYTQKIYINNQLVLSPYNDDENPCSNNYDGVIERSITQGGNCGGGCTGWLLDMTTVLNQTNNQMYIEYYLDENGTLTYKGTSQTVTFDSDNCP